MDPNLPKTVNELALPVPSEMVGKKIIMFGLPECPDCLRIKKYFVNNAIEYEYHDVDSDQAANKWLTSFIDHVPVLIMLDGSLMYSPSNDNLHNKINQSSVNKTVSPVEPPIFDVVIIGGGPAGVTAAIYTARKALKTLIITKEFGGQAIKSGDIENYPGFTIITGADLMTKFKEDVEHFKGDGLWFKEGVSVTGIEGEEGRFVIKTDLSNQYSCKTVILASGRVPKYLGIPGEKELLGKGVATCATCDGPLFKGKDVAIVGGGNSALDAANYLLKLAKSLIIINITPELKGDQELLNNIKSATNVTVLNSATATEIIGKDFVEGIKIKDANHEEKLLPAVGVFIEIGWVPAVDFVPNLAKDKLNQVVVNELGETSVPGIWAAGDVNNLWGEQIIIAAGEGAKVALAVAEHINKIPHQATSNIHEG